VAEYSSEMLNNNPRVGIDVGFGVNLRYPSQKMYSKSIENKYQKADTE
jgi:hypothetical protein